MNPEEFRQASGAAEEWLMKVAFVVERAPTSDVMVNAVYGHFLAGYGVHRPVAAEYDAVRGVLDEWADRLRVKTSGRVEWTWGGGEGRFLPSFWSTAHEAAVGLVEMTLDTLSGWVPDDEPTEERSKRLRSKAKWCGEVVRLTYAKANDLQERIRRERAAVLDGLPAGGINGSDRVSTDDPVPPPLDDTQRGVLAYLVTRKGSVVHVQDIAAGSDVDRKTCGLALKALAGLGLVAMPDGKQRKGYFATPTGMTHPQATRQPR